MKIQVKILTADPHWKRIVMWILLTKGKWSQTETNVQEEMRYDKNSKSIGEWKWLFSAENSDFDICCK